MDGWKDLSGDERAQWMDKAKGKCGKDLKKLMVDTVEEMRIDRETSHLHVEDFFYNVSGPENEFHVNTQFKDDPEALKHCLENGRRITCPVTKEEKVWVPGYSAGKKLESITKKEKPPHYT